MDEGMSLEKIFMFHYCIAAGCIAFLSKVRSTARIRSKLKTSSSAYKQGNLQVLCMNVSIHACALPNTKLLSAPGFLFHLDWNPSRKSSLSVFPFFFRITIHSSHSKTQGFKFFFDLLFIVDNLKNSQPLI